MRQWTVKVICRRELFSYKSYRQLHQLFGDASQKQRIFFIDVSRRIVIVDCAIRQLEFIEIFIFLIIFVWIISMKIFVFFVVFFVIFFIDIILSIQSMSVFIIRIQYLQQLLDDHDLIFCKSNAVYSIASGFIEQERAKDVKDQLFPMIDVPFERRRLLRKTERPRVRMVDVAA